MIRNEVPLQRKKIIDHQIQLTLHTAGFKCDDMFGKKLVHLEHVSAVSLKHNAQSVIAYYLPLVTRILEIVLPYVSPKLPHDLERAKD